ncbi:MAG: IPT/TIG domain-containing protein [Bacteriovoracia bacterium]
MFSKALKLTLSAVFLSLVFTLNSAQAFQLNLAMFWKLGVPLGPPPTITAVTPSSGEATNGLTLVAIIGTNFQTGATVKFAALDCTSVVVINSNAINCQFPSNTSFGTSGGSVNVSVTNPDGQTVTLTNGFYYYPFGAPSVGSTSPSSGSTAGGNVISINGSRFHYGATVTIGGVACTNMSYQSTGTLKCRVPAHAAGAVDVVVTNPDTTTSTLTNGYTYQKAWTSPEATELAPVTHCMTGGMGVGCGAISMNTSGNAMALFIENHKNRNILYYSIYNSGTTTWSATAALRDLPYISTINPVVAFDNNGKAIAAWEESDGLAYYTYVSRYDAGWSTPVAIGKYKNSYYRPTIAMNKTTGDAYVYVPYAGPFFPGGEYLQKFTAATSTWSPIVLSYASVGDNYVNMDMNSSGDVVLAYLSGSSPYTVKAITYSSSTSTWSTPTTISSFTQSIYTGSPPFSTISVSINSSGNAVVSWLQYDGSSNMNAVVNLYDATTETWGTAMSLSTTANYAGTVSGIDDFGNVIVAWKDGSNLNYKHYDAGTSTWGSTNSFTPNSLTYYALSVSPNGNAQLAYHEYNGGLGTMQLYARRYVKATDTWDAAQAIETKIGQQNCLLGVSNNGTDTWTVLWEKDQGWSGNGNLDWHASVASGSTWGSVTTLSTPTYNTGWGYKIVVDGSDNMVQIFPQKDSTTRTRLYARYKLAGGSWSSPVTIDSGANSVVTVLSLSSDASGNMVAIWVEGMYVYYNRYTFSTHTWGAASSLTPAYSVSQCTANNAAGDIVLSYGKYSGSYYLQTARVYSQATQTWSSETQIQSSHTTTSVSGCTASINSSSNAVVAWLVGWDPGSGNIYEPFTNYYTSGSWNGTDSNTAFDGYDVAYYSSGGIKVTIDNSNRKLLVFMDNATNGSGSNIVYSSFDSGGGWSIPSALYTGGNYNYTFDTFVDSLDDIVMVWYNYDNTTGNLLYSAIWDGPTTTWGTPTQITLNGSSHSSPKLVRTTGDNAIVVYVHSNIGPGVMTYDGSTKTFGSATAVWSTNGFGPMGFQIWANSVPECSASSSGVIGCMTRGWYVNFPINPYTFFTYLFE